MKESGTKTSPFLSKCFAFHTATGLPRTTKKTHSRGIQLFSYSNPYSKEKKNRRGEEFGILGTKVPLKHNLYTKTLEVPKALRSFKVPNGSRDTNHSHIRTLKRHILVLWGRAWGRRAAWENKPQVEARGRGNVHMCKVRVSQLQAQSRLFTPLKQ